MDHGDGDLIRFILAMGFLNNLNQKVLVIFILLINTCVYGLAKGQNEIDSIRITYDYHNGGYGIFRSTACYAFHKKAYKLQLEKSHNVHNAQQLPKTISKESVSKLLNDCNTYAIEDRCEFIKITKDDYSNYIKIINDKDSLDNYLPFWDDFKKEQYELEEGAFMSLSRSDIVNIIESSISPTSFIGAHSKPTLIIELICNNAGSITIEPQWYFDGTPWKVLSQGKERYVGHEYVMSFLKDIQYDKYPLFWERFYLLLQIADMIKKKTKSHTWREFGTFDEFKLKGTGTPGDSSVYVKNCGDSILVRKSNCMDSVIVYRKHGDYWENHLFLEFERDNMHYLDRSSFDLPPRIYDRYIIGDTIVELHSYFYPDNFTLVFNIIIKPSSYDKIYRIDFNYREPNYYTAKSLQYFFYNPFCHHNIRLLDYFKKDPRRALDILKNPRFEEADIKIEVTEYLVSEDTEYIYYSDAPGEGLIAKKSPYGIFGLQPGFDHFYNQLFKFRKFKIS